MAISPTMITWQRIFDTITAAEHELYSFVDHNEETDEIKTKEKASSD